MSLSILPASLIAQIADSLKYSDICNLMETNKVFHKVIKRYREDTIELSDLTFYLSSGRTNMNAKKDFAPYSFKNWNKIEENVDKVKQVLEKCSSIGELYLGGKGSFNNELFLVLMNTKVKIGTLYLHCDEQFSFEEQLKIGQKFRVVFTFLDVHSALLNDKFLTKILPRSTIRKSFFEVDATVTTLMPITDLTLNALIGEHKLQGTFSIECVHNSITIKGIVKVIKILSKRAVEDNLIWNFGIDRYFGVNGQMRGICHVEIAHKPESIHYKIYMFEDGFKVYKYRIFFNVIKN